MGKLVKLFIVFAVIIGVIWGVFSLLPNKAIHEIYEVAPPKFIDEDAIIWSYYYMPITRTFSENSIWGRTITGKSITIVKCKYGYNSNDKMGKIKKLEDALIGATTCNKEAINTLVQLTESDIPDLEVLGIDIIDDKAFGSKVDVYTDKNLQAFFIAKCNEYLDGYDGQKMNSEAKTFYYKFFKEPGDYWQKECGLSENAEEATK